jgi:hypothetical protein
MIRISGMNHPHGAQTRRSQSDERGMAAIIITMVTMVVISLIVIGFATISRREQRQSLDQLQSAQAFYAAESGIEDAKAVIKSRMNAVPSQPIIAKDSCTGNNPGGTYPLGNDTKIDGNSDVSYTCLKVNPNPDTLQFDGIGDNSLIVPIKTVSPITSIEISWRPTTDPGGSPNVCPGAAVKAFSPQSGSNSWKCGYGVLRADVVPTGGALTRNNLSAGQLTGFFVPLKIAAPGSLVYGGNTGKANVVAANCTTGSYVKCTARITGMGGSNSVSLRLSSLYQPSKISVQAFAGPVVQNISGVQAIIDSTGKATDVLRRIQVRLPIVQTGSIFPSNALTSNGSICKRFSVADGYLHIPNDIVDPDIDNKMCESKTDGVVN